MLVQSIKLPSNPNHINEFLTHWTGRKKDDMTAFEILSKIVDTGELKFSSNKISFPIAKWTISNQMICFTDTPIEQSFYHCERYNYFGISFNKNELLEYGANPVLYLVENRQKHQEFINSVNPKDNETKNLSNWLNGILQPYDTKQFTSESWAEFYEREWRIVRILPFHWINVARSIHGEFNEYPFKGKIRRHQIDDNPNNEEFYLPFDKSIIENLIVPANWKISLVEDLINRNNLNCNIIALEK